MRAPILLACVLLGAGCSRAPREANAHEPPPPAPAPIADAGAWGSKVAPARAAGSDRAPASALERRAALMSDASEQSDEPTLVGRFVYRVSFVVPPTFRDRRTVVRAPAGELHLDVSLNRLRARLVGPGWPADEGTEIRLRGDLLGVYLFDGRGGRSLGAGQLAAWFEGREAGEAQTRVGVRREWGAVAQRAVPGELLCALLAEWGRQQREALAYRCSAGQLPPGFRIGPWSGELTAVVPMELPRRALRADEIEPPSPITARSSRSWLEAEAISRLVPSRPAPEGGTGSLRVENRTDTRAIVLAQGVAVGWVDAGQSLRVDGFAAGHYRVGAIRPLGVLRVPPKLLRIPGELVIGRSSDL